MANLIRAELLKMTKNLRVTMFTVGVMPALAFVLLNIFAILEATAMLDTSVTVVNWKEQILLALIFAINFIAQIPFIILTAVSFGGESSWNTWKNILPRNQRVKIALSKLIVIALAIFFAIHSLAIATFIGSWEISIFSDKPFIGNHWGNPDINFFAQYFVTSFLLFSSFFIAVLFTILATIQTQSMSAGIVLGGIVTFADTVAQPALSLVSTLLNLAFIADLAQVLPNYQIQNIVSWILTGTATFEWSVSISSLILLLWVLAGIGLILFLFQRRDFD